jgi:hypothetical protein
VDLPDPRADEAAEAERLQRLRRLRDRLLIAAAVAILLIGLSLVGMAYMASNNPGAQVNLVPVQQPAPAQQSAPAQQPAPAQQSAPAQKPASGAGAGQAPPDGTNCPSGYPIKGNRTSKIYHQPGGGFYEQTRPEVCFAGPAEAESAGYRRSQR